MSSLIAKIVTRNASKEITSKDAADKIAVILDKKNSTAEVIDVDRIDVSQVVWSRDQGFFQTLFRLGGLDSKGNFHAALQYQPATWSIRRDADPEAWSKYGLNDLQSLDLPSILQWLHDANAIRAAGADVWKIAGLESEMANT